MNAPANITTWPELLNAVESNHGIKKVPMAILRQLEGRQRVGKHILNDIEEKLSILGLGHLPLELPNRQQQSVMLYRYGSPASELVRAVTQGLTEPVEDSTYEYLYRLNASPDPESVVSKEEFSEAVQHTAQSVLNLLNQVNPAEEAASTPTTAPEKEESPNVDAQFLKVVVGESLESIETDS